MCAVSLQIHWFSIINSCVTVLLLTGFLATILMRVLKNDFVKYTKDDEAGGSPCQHLEAGLFVDAMC
jgi:Endomembrane protein 70